LQIFSNDFVSSFLLVVRTTRQIAPAADMFQTTHNTLLMTKDVVCFKRALLVFGLDPHVDHIRDAEEQQERDQ
jgi:hypothetical protein